VRAGNVHSADLFYNPTKDAFDVMASMGVLAVEMEAAGLYGLAAEYGVRALALLTVSDHVRTGEATSPDERERGFGDMVRLALRALHIDAEA
jgi:purine-nucleoside phosphorylase